MRLWVCTGFFVESGQILLLRCVVVPHRTNLTENLCSVAHTQISEAGWRRVGCRGREWRVGTAGWLAAGWRSRRSRRVGPAGWHFGAFSSGFGPGYRTKCYQTNAARALSDQRLPACGKRYRTTNAHYILSDVRCQAGFLGFSRILSNLRYFVNILVAYCGNYVILCVGMIELCYLSK